MRSSFHSLLDTSLSSRSAISRPQHETLKLHTTFIMKDRCKNAENKCSQISEQIMRSLEHKEKKNFEWMDWQTAVLNDGNIINLRDVFRGITNKPWRGAMAGDEWIKKLIVQIPIQIARGTSNKFKLMHNGEDDQKEYIKAVDAYSLCKAIRFGAYDGLIKSWEGPIKVVTSMGKQSTGKSYMLNHLFGTKFDNTSTDGVWLSVRVVDGIMYIICDFEGLGSIERSPQEDMLLATFNAAISNCTIFKCDSRFDGTLEDMFSSFQSGVKIMAGSNHCFIGLLLFVIRDVVETSKESVEAEFERHIGRLMSKSEIVVNEDGDEISDFFVNQMYANGLGIISFPPLGNEGFFRELNDTMVAAICGDDDDDDYSDGGWLVLNHFKLIMSKLSIGDYSAMSGEQAKIRMQEIRETVKNAVEVGCIVDPPHAPCGVTFQVDDHQNLLLLDGKTVVTIYDIHSVVRNIRNYRSALDGFSKDQSSIDAEDKMLKLLNSIDDAGLILEKDQRNKLLEFMYDLFQTAFPRNRNNFKEWTILYQVFLDLIFFRRKERVMMYIAENTKMFEEEERFGIEATRGAAQSHLNIIRVNLELCGQKCADCYYPCLLRKYHKGTGLAEFDEDHCCMLSHHQCRDHPAGVSTKHT